MLGFQGQQESSNAVNSEVSISFSQTSTLTGSPGSVSLRRSSGFTRYGNATMVLKLVATEEQATYPWKEIIARLHSRCSFSRFS